MSKPDNTVSTNSVGFSGMLFIVFLVLKLTHVINWSWWWVTAPLWGSIALFLAIFLIIVSLLGVVTLFEGKNK